MRCQGITKAKRRCKLNVGLSGYCRYHTPKREILHIGGRDKDEIIPQPSPEITVIDLFTAVPDMLTEVLGHLGRPEKAILRLVHPFFAKAIKVDSCQIDTADFVAYTTFIDSPDLLETMLKRPLSSKEALIASCVSWLVSGCHEPVPDEIREHTSPKLKRPCREWVVWELPIFNLAKHLILEAQQVNTVTLFKSRLLTTGIERILLLTSGEDTIFVLKALIDRINIRKYFGYGVPKYNQSDPILPLVCGLQTIWAFECTRRNYGQLGYDMLGCYSIALYLNCFPCIWWASYFDTEFTNLVIKEVINKSAKRRATVLCDEIFGLMLVGNTDAVIGLRLKLQELSLTQLKQLQTCVVISNMLPAYQMLGELIEPKSTEPESREHSIEQHACLALEHQYMELYTYLLPFCDNIALVMLLRKHATDSPNGVMLCSELGVLVERCTEQKYARQLRPQARRITRRDKLKRVVLHPVATLGGFLKQ